MTTPITTVAPNSGPPSTLFRALPATWQNMDMKVCYVGVDGSFWNLAGNYAGKEGLTLAPKLTGFMHSPAKSIFSEGPYMLGAEYERTDYPKRDILMGVQVGVMYVGDADTSNWRYRMLEQKWWRAWSYTQDGTLCCYTRTHGWRFLKVRLAESPKTPFELDPTAFDNNFMQWDMQVVALYPYWSKRMNIEEWQNNGTTGTTVETIQYMLENVVNKFLGALGLLSQTPGDGLLQPGSNVGRKTFAVWNNGDKPSWPKFLASSPGQVWIQDGIGGNMIPLPLLSASEGTIMIDTDPTTRTLTATQDPTQTLLGSVASSSQLLEIILDSTGLSDKPIWQQFPYFFTQPIPANTLANIAVYHSDPNGQVAILVPQGYDKAYG